MRMKQLGHLLSTILWSAFVVLSADSDCFYSFPGSNGIWTSHPPYFTPDCAKDNFQVFDKVSTESCLRGRTVYAVGNSIARQELFGILEMLGGASVSRQEQKKLCSSEPSTKWEASCHQSFANINFRYVYIQWMDNFTYSDGFPFLNQSFHADMKGSKPLNVKEVGNEKVAFLDNCIDVTMEACLTPFFANAKPQDILLINVGLTYGLFQHKAIDHVTWVKSHAITFRKLIDRLFPGKVFWISNAYIWMNRKHCTPTIRMIDEQSLAPVFTPPVNGKRWATIDQWKINEDKEHLYSDYVHYPGPLGDATLYQILNNLCPNTGLSSTHFVNLANKILVVPVASKGTSANSSYYLIDHRFRLHSISPVCFPFLRTKEQISVSERVFQGMLHESAFPNEICREGFMFGYNRELIFMMHSDGKAPPTTLPDGFSCPVVERWVLDVVEDSSIQPQKVKKVSNKSKPSSSAATAGRAVNQFRRPPH